MGTTPSNSLGTNAKLWADLSLASHVLLSADAISENAEQIAAVWSQRDVIASRKRIYSTTYTRSSSRYIPSPPVELHSVVGALSHYSPSRKRLLRFTTIPDSDVDPAPLIAEVWNVEGGLERVWKIDDALHGPVYTDEWFGSVSWSPDEKMVIYVADRPPPATAPESEPDDARESWIEPLQHKFSEDSRDPFGEAFISRRSPALFIADIEGGRSVLASAKTGGKSEHLLFGEPEWSPDGTKIVATMRQPLFLDVDADPEHIRHRPYELGLRYCYNRYAAIVAFDAPKSGAEIHSMHTSMKVISNDADLDDFCCTSPRFSPNSEHIVYISAPRTCVQRSEGKVLPHNSTKVLRAIYVADKQYSAPSTIIPVPHNPAPDEFPGLYLHGLPDNPWLDANTLAFTSVWGSVNRVLSVSLSSDDGCLKAEIEPTKVTDWNVIASNAMQKLSGESNLSNASMSLLDVNGNAMVISASDPTSPSRIYCLQFSSAKGLDTTIIPVSNVSEKTRRIGSVMRSMKTVDLVLMKDNTVEAFDISRDCLRLSDRFQVTVMLPKAAERRSPLIVYPHGGPHVSTLNGYSQGTVALLTLGFAVMYVNYKGSLGLGQKSLETLPGNVGDQDVTEIVESTYWALKQKEFMLDSDRVGFVGGSHSGFLGAHTSLYPGLFKRTVLRNPVTNVATMSGATDIPDWCYCEGGLQQKNANGVTLSPDADQLRVLYELSPVSRVKNLDYWKTRVPAKLLSSRPGPTLLQVGGSDRRVPPQQSLEWKRILTETYGSEIVTIRWYPQSGHAIDEVPNGDDAWVHALNFLCKL